MIEGGVYLDRENFGYITFKSEAKVIHQIGEVTESHSLLEIVENRLNDGVVAYFVQDFINKHLNVESKLKEMVKSGSGSAEFKVTYAEEIDKFGIEGLAVLWDGKEIKIESLKVGIALYFAFYKPEKYDVYSYGDSINVHAEIRVFDYKLHDGDMRFEIVKSNINGKRVEYYSGLGESSMSPLIAPLDLKMREVKGEISKPFLPSSKNIT